MLTLSKQSDYGLMVLQKLYNEKSITPLSRLIAQTHLPPRFLARICAILVRNKLLISKEGRIGGYMPSPRLQQISFFDYLSIFEKKISFVSCLSSKKRCKYDSVCQHKNPIKLKLNTIVLHELKRLKLRELLQ